MLYKGQDAPSYDRQTSSLVEAASFIRLKTSAAMGGGEKQLDPAQEFTLASNESRIGAMATLAGKPFHF